MRTLVFITSAIALISIATAVFLFYENSKLRNNGASPAASASPSATTSSDKISNPTPTASGTPRTIDNATPPSNIPSFNVGQPIMLSDNYSGQQYSFTVTNAYHATFPNIGPPAGEDFLVIDIQIENKSQQEITYNTSGYRLTSKDGVSFNAFDGYGFPSSISKITSGRLLPGLQAKGSKIFMVPKEVKGFYYILNDKIVNITTE